MSPINYTILIIIYFKYVLAKSCVTYDYNFENFNVLKSQELCNNTLAVWTVGNYMDLGLTNPYRNGTVYITPDREGSCLSSSQIEIEFGGTLEIISYMDTRSLLDQIQIVVSNSKTRDIVAHLILTSANPENKGWRISQVKISGHNETGSFNAFIEIIGMSSKESTVIIDSYRYMSPITDGEHCVSYESSGGHRDILTQEEKCMTFTFERDFSTEFDKRGCSENATPWHTGRYSLMHVPSPHKSSTTFIKPSDHVQLSCTSSPIFHMSFGGQVQAHVYQNLSDPQQWVIRNTLTIMVYDDSDGILGSLLIRTENDPVNSPGWYTFKGTLSFPGNYKGYVSFIGRSLLDSDILVDSLKYTPPFMNEDKCNIYDNDEDKEDNSKEDSNESVESNSSEENGTNEKDTSEDTESGGGGDGGGESSGESTEHSKEDSENSKEDSANSEENSDNSEEDSENGKDDSSSSEENGENSNESDQDDSKEDGGSGVDACITYAFEKDYDTLFDNTGGCDWWVLGNYTSLPINGPGLSKFFISPTENPSCVTSFTFPMNRKGNIEVNVFIDGQASAHCVTIQAFQKQNGTDTLVGIITPMNSNSIDGWYVYRGTLRGDENFNGYITFTGQRPRDSIVLIDSFRYYSNSFDENRCNIYDYNPTPGTSTTEAEPEITDTETPTFTVPPITTYSTFKPTASPTEIPITITDSTKPPPITTTESIEDTSISTTTTPAPTETPTETTEDISTTTYSTTTNPILTQTEPTMTPITCPPTIYPTDLPSSLETIYPSSVEPCDCPSEPSIPCPETPSIVKDLQNIITILLIVIAVLLVLQICCCWSFICIKIGMFLGINKEKGIDTHNVIIGNPKPHNIERGIEVNNTGRTSDTSEGGYHPVQIIYSSSSDTSSRDSSPRSSSS